MTIDVSKEPLGSTSPYVLFVNAQNTDFAVNSVTQAIWTDRFGRGRKTLWGMEQEFITQLLSQKQRFNLFIQDSGYKVIGEYSAGPLTITEYNQIIHYDKELWKLTAATALPFTTTGNDATSWGTDKAHFVSVGDAALRADMSSDKYQFIAGTNNLLTAPADLVYGPGKVTISGKEFTNFIPGLDILHSSIYMTPEDAINGAGLGFPSGGNGNLNAILSVGAHPETATSINRSAALGTQNFIHPIQIDRCEAFGNGALMKMLFGERTTAIGTISCQYLGINDPQGEGHNWFGTAESGGFLPGQPGWDYGGFETANPGIGAKIAAFKDFAKAPGDCGRVVGVGRNTFNGTVLARNSTALGYRASASAYAVEGQTAVGADAFRSAIFVNASEAIGYLAATNWQEGQRNLVAGNQSAVKVVRGNSSIHLGAFAGSNFTDSNFNIFLGVGAGNNISTTTLTPSYCLAIGHDITGVAGSLIAGKMDTRRLGVNTVPDNLMGTFHIRTSDFGPATPAHSNGDDLIVESSGNTGMTIRSGATGFGTILFASPTIQNRAGLVYNHSTDVLAIRAGGGDRCMVDSGAFYPGTDNAISFGKPANRPTVIYAVTGTINVSDETVKKRLAMLAAEKAAALEIKGDMWKFQFDDAITEKGPDGARYHFGVGAQSVGEILRKHGLDPHQYAFFCYDEWDDQYETIPAETVSHPAEYSTLVDGNGNPLVLKEAWEEVVKPEETVKILAAGNRYGIRYEELLCFIMAAI